MALRDLSDRAAVVAALDEFDRIGRTAFLTKYGFGRAQRYLVRRDGRLYDSKAIAAAAHGHQFGRALTNQELYGGVTSAVPKLRSLGFEVVEADQASVTRFDPSQLVRGQIYSWEELASLFGFEVGWLNRMGGMGSLPRHDAVLIITHPGGGKSFDYDDYWEDADLIYTGKGQTGDQRRTSENRYVGDNLRTLLVFEQAGPAQLRYVGSPVCIDEWPEVAPDRHEQPRQVLRFRLRFERSTSSGASGNGRRRQVSTDPDRRPRPFDPSRPPRPRAPAGRRRDPAETAALQEKAAQDHHELVTMLNNALLVAGWSEVEEIPAAIDLWARNPNGDRTIFEVKTLRPSSELDRVRGAIGQLLEYRFFHGDSSDRLCLVTDHPLSDKRVRLLGALDIAVMVVDDDRLLPGSPNTRERLAGLLSDSAGPRINAGLPQGSVRRPRVRLELV